MSEELGGLPIMAGEQVGVDVAGHVDAAVAEPDLDNLEGNPECDQERAVKVPELVKCQDRKPQLFGGLFQLGPCRLDRAKRAATRAFVLWEDEILVLPVVVLPVWLASGPLCQQIGVAADEPRTCLG